MAGSEISADLAHASGSAGQKGPHMESDEKENSEKNGQLPSPNDDSELSKENTTGSTESNKTVGNDGTSLRHTHSGRVILPGNEKGPQEPPQGAGAVGGQIPSPNDLESSDSNASGASPRLVGSSGSAPSLNDTNRTSGRSSPAVTTGSIQNQRMEHPTAGTDDELESIHEQKEGNSAVRDSSAGSSTSGPRMTASPNPSNSATAPASTVGPNRTKTSSGPSARQQSTTTINCSGGDQTIDENVRVNETQGNTTQGTRNVTSNTSGASGGGEFHSDTPAAPGASSTSSSGSNRTINQDSASRENIVNETMVNRNHPQHTQQTDQTNVNDMRRPHTHHLNQESSNTIDRIKNYRRGR
ncbi:hypothetical protein [Planococcus versutus]|uniref:Uncharacterized protein n=1 Tax=Planococcus versutus TaxID=1302659 RepID=A0A1B1S5W6_9BACL|nr:hypothetical protein [Planococcus versutus]ANU28577.1 hypothetical protein I858_016480 [Planococcus versutus]